MSNRHCEGPKDARVVLIGEALGADEVRLGRPFVGVAGQLLDQCLSGAGIVRPECYITNVFDFHPKLNDIKPFISFNSKGEAATSDEYEKAVRRLKHELEQTTSKVFVALGNVPMYVLTGMHGITKWRGSVLPCTLLRDRTVVVSLHPSFANRTGLANYKYFITMDLEKAQKLAGNVKLRTPTRRDFATNPSFDEAIEFLLYCKCQPRVGVDIEVTYIRDSPMAELSHIGLAVSSSEAMCIPLLQYHGLDAVSKYTVEHEAAIMRELGALLRNEAIVKVGQNFMFDAFFLLHKYGIVTKNILDTMIAQAVLYPDFPKGLDFLTSQYLYEPYYKGDGKRWQTREASDNQFALYNCKDSAFILDILDEQQLLLDEAKLTKYFLHKCRLIEPLLAIQRRGFKLDLALREQFCVDAKRELEEKLLEYQCKFARGKSVDDVCTFFNSPKQLATYFYIEKGYKPYRKGGSVTTDHDAMVRLSTTQQSHEAKIVLDVRHLTKRISTYFTTTVDDDGRMRCAYDPVGAGSRLSSRKTIFGTGGNMQTAIEEINNCLVASPGYCLVNFDLEQAENRIVAYIWGVQAMIEAFENGIDVHRRTASLILGKPEGEISDVSGSAISPSGEVIGPGNWSERTVGKRANHAFNYDLGYVTFAIKNRMEQSMAKMIRESYFRAYNEILVGHELIRKQLGRNRTLVDLLGRKRTFLDHWGDDLFRSAYSYIPQSTVGNKVNLHGIEFIYYELNKYHCARELHLLDQVHDSACSEFLVSEGIPLLGECCIRIKESLERPLTANGTEFVIPVGFSVGWNKGKYSSSNPKGLRKVAIIDDMRSTVTALEEALYDRAS